MYQDMLKPTSSLYKVLKEANYLELDMMDVGLINRSDKGYYDLFTRRIMFPICDEMGCGWSCIGDSDFSCSKSVCCGDCVQEIYPCARDGRVCFKT